MFTSVLIVLCYIAFSGKHYVLNDCYMFAKLVVSVSIYLDYAAQFKSQNGMMLRILRSLNTQRK